MTDVTVGLRLEPAVTDLVNQPSQEAGFLKKWAAAAREFFWPRTYTRLKDPRDARGRTLPLKAERSGVVLNAKLFRDGLWAPALLEFRAAKGNVYYPTGSLFVLTRKQLRQYYRPVRKPAPKAAG